VAGEGSKEREGEEKAQLKGEKTSACEMTQRRAKQSAPWTRMRIAEERTSRLMKTLVCM
jgi:hypothetical protein